MIQLKIFIYPKNGSRKSIPIVSWVPILFYLQCHRLSPCIQYPSMLVTAANPASAYTSEIGYMPTVVKSSSSLGRWTRKPRLSQLNRCLIHTHSQPPVLMGVRCLYQNAPILLMPKQAPQAMSFTGNLTSKPRSAVGNFPFREHHDDPIIQLGSSRIRGVLRGPQGRWLHDSAHNRITDGIFAPVSVERPSLPPCCIS